MLSTLPWNSMKKKYYIIHEFFTLYKLYYSIIVSGGIHILNHFLSWLSNRHLQKLHLFSIKFPTVLFWFTFWKIKKHFTILPSASHPIQLNIFYHIHLLLHAMYFYALLSWLWMKWGSSPISVSLNVKF